MERGNENTSLRKNNKWPTTNLKMLITYCYGNPKHNGYELSALSYTTENGT